MRKLAEKLGVLLAKMIILFDLCVPMLVFVFLLKLSLFNNFGYLIDLITYTLIGYYVYISKDDFKKILELMSSKI